MLYYERKCKRSGCQLIIGVDEVGRGSLAGPVVAAAVALKKFTFRNRIDDSKRLTPLQREKAFPEILDACLYGLGMADCKAIDRLNIAVATKYAMEEAVAELIRKGGGCKGRPVHILVDGKVPLSLEYPSTAIVGGDGRSLSIACASIVAKVVRDRMMLVYHADFPQYGFAAHKGYGTSMHFKALERLGPSSIHRMTFCGVA